MRDVIEMQFDLTPPTQDHCRSWSKTSATKSDIFCSKALSMAKKQTDLALDAAAFFEQQGCGFRSHPRCDVQV